MLLELKNCSIALIENFGGSGNIYDGYAWAMTLHSYDIRSIVVLPIHDAPWPAGASRDQSLPYVQKIFHQISPLLQIILFEP